MTEQVIDSKMRIFMALTSKTGKIEDFTYNIQRILNLPRIHTFQAIYIYISIYVYLYQSISETPFNKKNRPSCIKTSLQMTKKEEAEFSVSFISIKIMLAGWLINLKGQSSSTVKIFSGFIFIVYFFSLSYAVSWIWTQVENLKHTLWTALWSWTPPKQCVIKTEKIFLRSFSREIIKKRKPEWDTKLVDIYHDANVKMNKKLPAAWVQTHEICMKPGNLR